MFGRLIKYGLFIFALIAVTGAGAYFSLSFFITREPDIVVPDLSGKHVVTALELLSDFSLNTKIKGMEYSADIPKHHVIHQAPYPGAEIKPGRDVRITLSKGPETVVVPALKGLTLSQVRIVLEDNGLSSGQMAQVYQEKVPGDVIISQFPRSGTIIHREMPVDLLISLGKRPIDFIMPDLSGLSLNEAIQMIETLHLTLGRVKIAYDDNRVENRILEQFPRSGYRVFLQDAVNLTVSRSTTRKTDILTSRTGFILLRHQTKPGFINRHVRVHLNSFGISTNLVDAFLKPGREIWCFIPTEQNTAAFVYEDDQLVRSEVIQ